MQWSVKLDTLNALMIHKDATFALYGVTKKPVGLHNTTHILYKIFSRYISRDAQSQNVLE